MLRVTAEYCAVKYLSSALILIHPPPPLAILLLVQYGYHQLQKMCCWSVPFGYIEYLSKIKYFAATYSVTRKNSVLRVIIYCKFTQEKEYGYIRIHNTM